MLLFVDDDVLSIGSAAPTVLTPTKINRPGNSFINYIRVFNWGTPTAATGTLTFTSQPAGAAFALAVLTFTANPSAGDLAVIGGTTYTFASALTGLATPANVAVLIGGSQAASIANLYGAIVASSAGGQGPGTTYQIGTIPNASAGVSAYNSGSLTSRALAAGTAANSIAVSYTGASASWGAATFAGGTNSDTVTIGTIVYSFVYALSGAAYEVLIGGSTGATQANLAGAVNAATSGGQAAGTTYGFGTVANVSASALSVSSTVVATATTAAIGFAGNVVATTASSTACSWGTATLTGGNSLGEVGMIFYNFGGNNAPVNPPNSVNFTGIEIPPGGSVDIQGYDNLINLQFIAAPTQTAKLYIAYGTI
jgi:hypothetical protein